ncbi:MAG: HEAT repeat domain-containing protein [Phycisphaerales bacterium]|nr:HEAT repeat domain-containing protein [Phycisphaerales bacterium]
MSGSGDRQAESDRDVAGVGASPATNIEPMSGGLLARLFAVPMLIVGMIVGCAVVVVLLFGSIATDRQQSIESLLNTLKASAGETTAGVLLPRDKELWQVANELAQRMKNADSELTAEERDLAIDGLLGLHARDIGDINTLSEMGRKRLAFFMYALARSGSPRAVPPLVATLDASNVDLRVEALRALAEMGDGARSSDALPRMTAALTDRSPVVRTVACAALSAIARPGDAEVVDALGRASMDEDREVQWNAALALARLESDRGKGLLLDMLNRTYWEDEVKVRTVTPKGEALEYPMPPQAVNRYLIAAIDAGGRLPNDDIRDQIRALMSDASPEVKNAAMKAIGDRGGS